MKKLTCIICPRGCEMEIEEKNGGYIVSGNLCKRGNIYAVNEMSNPTRSITTTVRTKYKAYPRLPVKTDGEVEMGKVIKIMRALDILVLDHPVHIGEVIAENILDTGVNIIATAELSEQSEVM